MIDLKVNFRSKNEKDLRCPLCNVWDKTLEYIFPCDYGLKFPTWHIFFGDFLTKRPRVCGGFQKKNISHTKKNCRIEGTLHLYFHCFIIELLLLNKYCKPVSQICLDFCILVRPQQPFSGYAIL